MSEEREPERKDSEGCYDDSSDSALELVVSIDTPKGSHRQVRWVNSMQDYDYAGPVLPPGVVFPFDSGTLSAPCASDEVDVLVLDDEPHAVGFRARCRLIGVIEAEEKDGPDQPSPNRRYIAAALDSPTYGQLKSLDELDRNLVDRIENFFVSYYAANASEFKPLRRSGAARAIRLINKDEPRFSLDRPQAPTNPAHAPPRVDSRNLNLVASRRPDLPPTPTAQPVSDPAAVSGSDGDPDEPQIAPWLVFVVQYLLPVGRIGRGEFIVRAGVLFLTFYGLAQGIKAIGFDEDSAPFTSVATAGVGIFALVAVQSGKRLHDFNASAWWVLFMATGLGAFFMALMLALRPGTGGPNRFGDRAPTTRAIKITACLLGTGILILVCTHVGVAFWPDS